MTISEYEEFLHLEEENKELRMFIQTQQNEIFFLLDELNDLDSVIDTYTGY